MSHTKRNLSDEELNELLSSIGISPKNSKTQSPPVSAAMGPRYAKIFLVAFAIFFIGSAIGFAVGRASAPRAEIMPLLSDIKQAIDAVSPQNKLQEIIEPLWQPEDNARLAQKALV